MSDKLRWGIISTGRIAKMFAAALVTSRTGRLVAVGSRTREAGEAFAREFGGLRAHASYAALLADPEVQAVYIGTPHDTHAELSILAARAGKHVLCEKPLALNRADAARAIAAAREAGVFLMEAFMYRCHPQTAKFAELIRDGAIGEPKLLSAVFCFNRAVDLKSRLFDRALGGGAILDIGCYPVSVARLVAGALAGQPFAEPVEFLAQGRLHPVAQVDELAAATVRFPGGLIAQLACGITTDREISVRVRGTLGTLELPEPFHPDADVHRRARILLQRQDAKPEEISCSGSIGVYTLEADVVGDAIARGAQQADEMRWDDSLGNLAVLDRWRAALGLRYPGEA